MMGKRKEISKDETNHVRKEGKKKIKEEEIREEALRRKNGVNERRKQ